MKSHTTRALATTFLLIQAAWLTAAEVSFQKFHQEPKTPEEDPQDFIRICINKEFFQCASLSEWGLLANYGSWDFAAVAPGGKSGVIGVRVERCVDKENKAYPNLTKELVETEFKKLTASWGRCEGRPPELKEPGSSLTMELTRIDGNQVQKCRYHLELRGDQLWTFGCEAAPTSFETVFKGFSVLLGTFSKLTAL